MLSATRSLSWRKPSRLQTDRDRILIVDDDASRLRSFRWHSGGRDSRRFRPPRSPRAWTLARSRRPHLVILDIRLPDGNGLNMCQVMSDDPHTSGIPVIILSGMERPDIIRSCRAAGCRYYVRKPYDPNALLVLAENALGQAECW